MDLENIVEAAAGPTEKVNPAGVTDAGDAAPAAGGAPAGDADGDGTSEDTDEDAEGAGEDTGDDASDDDSRNPSRIDRRLAKLTASRKDAEARAEKAEAELARLKGTAASDAEAARLAEEAGVLPELVGADEARRIAEWRSAKANEKYLSEWLEDHDGDEELEAGGKSYARAEVRRMRREWRDRLERLGDGPARAVERAGRELSELLALGRAAREAGWKPGAKAPAAPAKAPAAKRPARQGATAPGEGHPERRPPARAAAPDVSKIGTLDDFAAAIAAGEL